MYRSESVWTTFDIATKVPCTSRSIQFWPPKFSSKSSICGQYTGKINSNFLIYIYFFFVFSVHVFALSYICCFFFKFVLFLFILPLFLPLRCHLSLYVCMLKLSNGVLQVILQFCIHLNLVQS